MTNIDHRTVDSFGDEWARFSQDSLSADERAKLFERYFSIFPWGRLPKNAEGFDMGCGSGRWAALVAPRVGRLNCVDASAKALAVAGESLSKFQNARLIHADTATCPLAPASQDFGYSLGVLHHIPDTKAAVRDCARLLRRGAPFLLYLYYRFDNKPAWYAWLWRASEVLRTAISRLPETPKALCCDAIAIGVYAPLSRLARWAELMGARVENWPLASYRTSSFYTLRTDSRDRFGTPLEQRFTRAEIETMMVEAGFENVRFSESVPYWTAVGYKT